MPKNLNLISCNCEQPEMQPMTFLYLDQLANDLSNILDEMKLDFERKTELIHEMDQQVWQSEETLLEINELRDVLMARMTNVESKLSLYESDMRDDEKTLKDLEQLVESVPNWLTNEGISSSERTQLLNLLAASEQRKIELNRLTEELTDFNEEINAQKPIWKQICLIVDFQVENLKQAENDLYELQDKINEINMSYEELKD